MAVVRRLHLGRVPITTNVRLLRFSSHSHVWSHVPPWTLGLSTRDFRPLSRQIGEDPSTSLWSVASRYSRRTLGLVLRVLLSDFVEALAFLETIQRASPPDHLDCGADLDLLESLHCLGVFLAQNVANVHGGGCFQSPAFTLEVERGRERR